LPTKFVVKLAACTALVSSLSLSSRAQQTPSATAADSSSSSSSSAAQSSSSSSPQSSAATPGATSPATTTDPAATPDKNKPGASTPQTQDADKNQQTTPAQPSSPSASAQTSSAQTNSAQTSSPQPGGGQTSDQTNAQTGDQAKDKNAQDQHQGKVAGTSNDRLFYALPNFLTLQTGQKLPPLTAGQKFKVVALSTFDYVQYPWWGILSAINQADNAEPAYGQGWLAYAKRYGTTAADSTVENFMVGAVIPSIIHQDPRFYQLSGGSFMKRTEYAISRIVVTRGDNGRSQFNFSEILGSASAAAISTYSYHPKSTYLRTPTNPHLFIPSDRTLSNTASVWGTQVALDTITIGLKEFWPDIQRKMSHKHAAASEAGPSRP
jgi:hypothetical protein